MSTLRVRRTAQFERLSFAPGSRVAALAVALTFAFGTPLRAQDAGGTEGPREDGWPNETGETGPTTETSNGARALGEGEPSSAEGDDETDEGARAAPAGDALGEERSQSGAGHELSLELSLDAGLAPSLLAPEEAPPTHLALEAALRLPTYDFDAVSFISSSRSLVTAVLETYCAAGLLTPDEEGAETLDIVLGVGCLLGATTLYITGIRRLVRPVEERRAIERLARFDALVAEGALGDAEVRVFEGELRAAARRDRRRRIFEIVFGGANLVATALLAGFT
ncbi:MAG: hypothetical protein AAF411_31065, partial [Myxococcota bacterium]